MRIPQLGPLAALALCSVAALGGPSTDARDDRARRKNEVVAPAVRQPLVFIENAGQWGDDVRYQVRIPGLTLGVHDDGWSLAGGAHVRVRFEDAGDGARASGREPLRGRANFFVGERHRPAAGGTAQREAGPERARFRDVPTFRRVLVEDMRPGVDLELYENAGRIEYDLVIAPGEPLDEIVFRFEGVEDSRITEDGALVAVAGGSTLRQRPPVAWETGRDGGRRDVPCRFRDLGEGRFGFEAPDRDPSRELVIDPVLVYSEFVGGSNADEARAVALDWAGNVYVAGWAKSADFPGARGRRSGRDVVVFQLEAGTGDLVYTATLGGGLDDEATGIAVDDEGRVTLVGWTKSDDFPTTGQAHARENGGGRDAFALRLSADGERLEWSTLLGGSAQDEAAGLALEPDGSLFLVGTTTSPDFPTTSHALQPERQGGRDGFVTKLDQDGRVLVFSSYLGGVRDDRAYAVAVDGNGYPHVVGRTDSADFPITTGSFDGRKADVDGYVVKLSKAGGHLLYSTFLGGTGQDEALAIALDEDDQAWVAGWTQSYDFPTTLEAFQETNRARRDGFAVRISPAGGLLTYGTYLGGGGTDEVHGVALDAFGVPWFVGNTTSDDLPVTSDASQEARGGGRDAFLLGLEPWTGQLTFGTYLGSGGHEGALAIGSQPNGEGLVLAGRAENVAPEERGPLSGNKVGPSDALVARFEPGLCGLRAEMTSLGAPGGVELYSTLPRLGKPFRIGVTSAPPETQGYVVMSSYTQSSTLVEGLLELHVDRDAMSVLFSFQTDANGTWETEFVLPRLVDYCGRTVVVQAVTLDRDAGPLSFGQLSQGLLYTLGD